MELLPFLVGAPAPRTVRIDGQRFVAAGSNATLIMVGPNVVVKGPPYLPSVSGTLICNDTVDDAYAARRSGRRSGLRASRAQAPRAPCAQAD